MPNSRQTTSAKNWRKRNGTPVELPSGNTAMIKRPGMPELLSAGILPDNLTPIALAAVQKGQGPGSSTVADQEIIAEMVKDQNSMMNMFLAFDKVTAMCVMEPKVRLHIYNSNDELQNKIPEGYKVGDKIPEEDRDLSDDGPLYTDEVDQEDKTFIFQYVVGGTKDLESFRKQYGAALETVQPGADVPLST